MSGPELGRYRARFDEGPGDVARAQALRFRRFRAGGGDGRDVDGRDVDGRNVDGRDGDGYDARARHVLVEETATGRLVCCFRLTPFADGSGIGGSYSAQFYGLGGLARYPGRMLEIGRFCVEAGETDPTVLRVAWGALGDYVAAEGIELLFGCSSFAGTEAEAYADAFALLRDRHLAPRRWLPRIKAPSVFRFARALRLRKPDLTAAMRAMPPLLRSYLAMGGWVSDHAVIDRDLGTLHVFTGLEIKSVPPARLRLLRAPAVVLA